MLKICLHTIFLPLILMVGHVAFPQSMKEKQQKQLDRIQLETREAYFESHQRAVKLAGSRDISPLQQTTDGGIKYLVGVDEKGFPSYYKTFNQDASSLTGASFLRDGNLGIPLFGEGMIVGVWDAGRVLAGHQEFGGRVDVLNATINDENGADHATHVTGTILASGINASAKGMAPMADVINFDFLDDLSEISGQVSPDQQTLLISNHSYGFVVGWDRDANNNWEWFGDASVSEEEDYRFGFYTSKARSLDEITYNAPYYTIVWAAGNDRTDTGDGSFPADGNKGTGFDSVGPEGASKNIIVVGAARKFEEYNSPRDVGMSTFSGWGPVDDGRIKPDIAGVGVDVLSTSAASEDAYTVKSGTSMASPNVTGNLVLLQELYSKLNGGDYMRSSTLKNLIIHTSKEAGSADGPDYRFGWGLIDGESAGRLIMDEKNDGIIMKELVLNNNESFETFIDPFPGTEIKVSIAWTDVPGNTISPSLDPKDLILVNDLDVRLEDEDGIVSEPWILDPENPSLAAVRGDNFRDNVEKIRLDSARDSRYRISVTHKDTLENDLQEFSLIVSFTPKESIKSRVYWVGYGESMWSDHLSWSGDSGGDTLKNTPGENDLVFFDANSFQSQNDTILLDSDITVGGLYFLTEDAVVLDLNGHSIDIMGDFVSGKNLTVQNGAIVMRSSEAFLDNNLIDLNNRNYGEADLIIEGNKSWSMVRANALKSISLSAGELIVNDQIVSLDSLVALNNEGNKSLIVSDAHFMISNKVDLHGDNLTFDGRNVKFQSSGDDHVTFSMNEGSYDLDLIIDSPLEIFNEIAVDSIYVANTLLTQSSISLNVLNLQPEATLNLAGGSTIQILDTIMVNSSGDRLIPLFSEGSSALFNFNRHAKICADHFRIENVDYSGNGTFNIGENSVVINAQNWSNLNCDDALFADFSIDYACQGSLVYFNNHSSGNITSNTWQISRGEELITISESSPTLRLDSIGTYEVALTIANEDFSSSFSRDMSVGENTIQNNTIIVSGVGLASLLPGDSYQWFRDGERIDGANERVFDTGGEGGTYSVLLFADGCNKMSEPMVLAVTGLDSEVSDAIEDFGMTVSPNPSDGAIQIEMTNDYKGQVDIAVIDLSGTEYYRSTHEKVEKDFNESIFIPSAPKVLILRVTTEEETSHLKLLIH